MLTGRSILGHIFQTVRSVGYGNVLFCLSLFSPILSPAQGSAARSPSYTIKGSVLDSVSGEALAAVTLAFRKADSDQIVKAAVTAVNGTFRLTALPNQAYELTITSLGYTPKRLRLPPTPEALITLDSLLLSPYSIAIEQVNITAKKNLVQYEADKLIYNVADDPESAYLTTFDILRKVPMLSIDGDDNIELNGNGNFQVLLNNRPSSLFVRSVEDALKSLPANSVKSIEIITNPPARYESEGIAGIINIITHKRTVTGYSGTVRAGLNAPGGPTTGGSLQAKAGKLGFSGLWGYSSNARPATTNSMYRLNKLNSTVLEQAGENRGNSRNLNGGGELSWQLNDQNLLNVHYNRTQYTSLSLSDTRANIRDANGLALQSYRSLNTYQSLSPGNDWGLDYQLSFKKNTRQLLTVSYKELRNSSLSESNNRVPEKINSFLSGGHSENDNSFTERTAQIDYVQPIKTHSFEVGLKSISRLNYSSYFFEREEAATGMYVRDPGLANQYDNQQDIYAGYASTSLKLGTWLLRSGVRVEQTNVTANFKTTQTQVSQSYFNIIPNATLSRRFGNSTNLTASYSQRLQRPSLYYINPFVNNQDPYNIYFGNPDLRATVSNVANLGFNTYTGKTNFSVNLNHTFTNNSILQFTTIGADTVARTTYGNIGNEQSSGISIGVGSTFFEKLSVNLNGSLNYRKYTSIMDKQLVTNDGFTYSESLNIGYTFPQNLRVNMSAMYTSATLSFQSRSIGYFSHNASLNYSFLKDRKASLSLSASSPFQPTRRNHTVTDLAQFYMVYDNLIIMHRYTLTVNYRFGKLQGGFKRNKRGITNDDL